MIKDVNTIKKRNTVAMFLQDNNVQLVREDNYAFVCQDKIIEQWQ